MHKTGTWETSYSNTHSYVTVMQFPRFNHSFFSVLKSRISVWETAELRLNDSYTNTELCSSFYTNDSVPHIQNSKMSLSRFCVESTHTILFKESDLMLIPFVQSVISYDHT